MAKTGRESFKFMLRMPDDLRELLTGSATLSGRSVTAEILERLESTYRGVREDCAEVLSLKAELAAERLARADADRKYDALIKEIIASIDRHPEEGVRIMAALRAKGIWRPE